MIDKGKKRIIVVLGMHRSGTSAITRGLQVMGVDLGNRLIPAVEDVNPKGFWEDIDLCQLNNELLGALGSDWHYLAPVALGDMEALQKNSYLSKAANLLSQKVDERTIFGFKDPRTIKLLPFWKEVSIQCQLDISCVLAIRHPLSVSQSLTKRDGFDTEKNYFLWLGHIIESLSGSAGLKRVLVDYDKLMLSPELELNRIAEKLDLKIDEVELKVYRSEFLDKALRHTAYSLNDLSLDEACPPLVREVYTTLLEIASGKTHLDDPALQNRITCWVNEYERLKPILTLVDKAFAHNTITDQAASLNQTVVERDEQIASLNQTMANLSSEISRLNHVLSCIYSSISWRITESLRKSRRMASVVKGPHLIGGQVFNVARGIFRRLPLSNSVKDKLRFLVLARSRIFTGYRPSSSFGHRPIPGNISEIAEEWTGYSKYVQFKHQLAKQLVIGQSERMPRREPLLSFDGKDLRRIASSISFELSPDPEVSIVIPVYGNASLTLECLVSIQNSTVAASYEIVLADDASKDRTPELLELVSGIKVHRNAENKGFLRNCNAVLLLATGEYVVYLNNDVQVTDGWLDDLLEVFSGYANAGAVGPKIVYPFGHLQEAGVALKSDGNADMVGLNDNPYAARYEYTRPVDYCSGACLMVRRKLLLELGGFSDEFAPAYCEDADLCLRIIERGYKIYYTPRAKVFHHLSKTTAADGMSNKLRQVSTNVVKLHNKWAKKLDELAAVKIIAFYLPQFHPIPENDLWWGEGFTEWTNVKKAQPNFVGHNQPKVPADLGYYDLRDEDVMVAQAALARKYGIDGFCFYYYWFGGSRLLDMPIERMLQTGRPNFPYCLCWANENWSRRWDGRDSEILIGQQHSPEDDRAVILDLIRHFKAPNYIRIDGRPHLIVYRVDLFPDFFATSKLWREICREQGVGEIYISMVESHDLVHKDIHPSTFGCNASIEFPPLNMAERISPSGEIMNPDFHGGIGDYRDTALRYCARALPSYTRFRGVMPGWDNTARRQNDGFCFEHSSPEVFQAWLEHTIRQTRQQHHGDEKIVFINAWNEWAEGAYLEPDTCHGHAFLEAVKNAKDAERLLNADMESHRC
jgi:GT2 family glycosyltransferase